MSHKIISERLYNINQSWNYEQVLYMEINDIKQKFKINIRRNSYDFQSFARVYVYSNEHSGWNRIVNAPISECKCSEVNYLSKKVDKKEFLDDRNRLLEEAAKICF